MFCVTACGADRPADVVEKMYKALQAQDQNSYLDTLLPANRKYPDLDGVLATLLGGTSVKFGGLGLDFDSLLTPSWSDIQYTTLMNDGEHAVVEARGFARSMMMEMPFCDMHDLTKYQGAWFVDKFHPDREVRLRRYIERNKQKLLEQNPNIDPNLDPMKDLVNAFATLGSSMEIMLNLCE